MYGGLLLFFNSPPEQPNLAVDENQPDYEKLPGTAYSTFSSPGSAHELHICDSHLLAVERTYIEEEYNRFFFEDIRALTVRKTIWGGFFNIVNIFLLVISILGLFLFGAFESVVGTIVGLVVVAVPATFFLVNWIKGPTCETFIHTAVQEKKLPSLDRVKYAEEVFERIEPYIQEDQEPFRSDELRERYREATEGTRT